MYAVIRTGGKQYKVEQGQELLVEKLVAEPGQTVEISDVLLWANDAEVSVGRPIAPVTVQCRCIGHEKGPKLRAIKYRRRKNYRRTFGHRQLYTRLSVEKIEKKG
ncbi:MAG: 50S ribosomal protein L21 [Deltaproteobacteria bacterium]|nr:50S ribosomal protein L21 [Deltaproteobacteria bacterium]